jgi:hypothetical protein
MNPILLPRTNRPLRVPILMHSSATSGVKAPQEVDEADGDAGVDVEDELWKNAIS